MWESSQLVIRTLAAQILPILGALALVAALAGVGTVVLNRRLRRVAKMRGAQALEETRQYFLQKGAPATVTEAVIQALQEYLGIRDFPILPADDIRRKFGIVNEDFGELVVDVLERCGCRWPPGEQEMKKYPSVRTVEELVGFVTAVCSSTKGA